MSKINEPDPQAQAVPDSPKITREIHLDTAKETLGPNADIKDASQSRRAKTSYLGKKEETTHRFTLAEIIGEGAMGEIVRAKDQDLLRKVAYKKILPEIAENPKNLQIFMNEAQITAQLEHPNIVPIYGLEVNSEGEIAYSMKMIQGKTLGDLIQEARQQYQTQGQIEDTHSLTELLEHFLKVCDAMEYAHQKGIIHRDLKPANLMIGPYNEVYVMDWGIARLMGENARQHFKEEILELELNHDDLYANEKGRVIGTPRYMSPQQAAGKNDSLDGRSDLFSLGLILFEITTLKKAFLAKTNLEIFRKVLKVELESMVHIDDRVKVPKELQAIILKATAKRPKDRYDCVADFADDIRRYLRGEAVLAQPDTWIQSGFRWTIKNKELTAIVFMGLLLFSASLSIYNIYQREQSLLAAQAHERALNAFLHDVVEQSQKINRHFISMQALLESLGNATLVLLEQKQSSPSPLPYLWNQAWTKTFQPSPFYKNRRSIDHWIGYISASAQQDIALSELNKLEPLDRLFKKLLLQSDGWPTHKNYSSEELWQKFAVEGTSIVYAYLGLESGAYLEYPAGLDFPKNYDARQRPWYKEARAKEQISWVTPYVDGTGLGLMISCEMPLYDSQLQFRGVAGMDMTFQFVKDSLLNMTDHKEIQAAYLLTHEGKVVIDSTSSQEHQVSNRIRKLESFHNQQVVDAIRKERSGYSIKGDHLTAYYKIESMGWYYVIEGKESSLLKSVSVHTQP